MLLSRIPWVWMLRAQSVVGWDRECRAEACSETTVLGVPFRGVTAVWGRRGHAFVSLPFSSESIGCGVVWYGVVYPCVEVYP